MHQPYHQETNPDQTTTLPTAPTKQCHIPRLRSHTGPRKLLQKINTTNYEKLKTTILDLGRIYAVSDGGMAEGYGSFGWTIACEHELMTGRGEAEGPRVLIQSFRAEGYGMLAALRFIYRMCEHEDTWPNTTTTVDLYCDNLALIKRIGWHGKRITTTPKDVSALDYDIEAEIAATIDTLARKNITINEHWVKGHQDSHKEYHNLTREAQLNIESNREAMHALKEHNRKEDYHQMPHTTAMVYLQGLPITIKTENTLRCAYLSHDLRKYMTQRENWNEHIADTIWWEAHKRALN